MTIKEIIGGLRFTIDMFLFDPSTGEEKTKDYLNDMDRMTVDACENAIKLLKELPSAEPQERNGKWIEEPNGMYRCSCCKAHYSSIMDYRFCPNCGARMEGTDGR